MKAVGYNQSLSITEECSLLDIERDKPVPQSRDICVNVKAISVNPVDTKIRQGVSPENGYKVLGWDCAGVVELVGDQVTLFQPGDRVWYAGEITRDGTNQEYHLVNESLASKMPFSLSFAEAAAMPLTSITAWEILFERFKLTQDSRGELLIIGGAGGVGSMMIQLAKELTNMTVIATASRNDSVEWVRSLGADVIVNYRNGLVHELKENGFESVSHIASLTHSDEHIDEIERAISPQGDLALIDDPDTFDIVQFKRKSVSVHWELMYTRSLYKTEDMIEQHRLLQQVANLVDTGKIKTTLKQNFGVINARNLKRAHALIESGTSIGKVVLENFE